MPTATVMECGDKEEAVLKGNAAHLLGLGL
jgi:hypothetical protein